jgi:predicted kinase
MNAHHHLRLPASELAKLGPARRHDERDATADVVRARAAATADAEEARRLRAPRHLSGFARA